MRCVPTATTCGHAMHSKCFQKFYDSLLESERNNLFRSVNVNVNWQEFICPACQRLCNSVAPLMPGMVINCLIIINLPICTYFCVYVFLLCIPEHYQRTEVRITCTVTGLLVYPMAYCKKDSVNCEKVNSM